ncbi:unnamed protein product [marine sediment metagenome]|uniref:Uncharacterized protein n=1 Tax=marine sediment metagenome TaxID=412755 RepID=X1BXX0_9ZZZZ
MLILDQLDLIIFQANYLLPDQGYDQLPYYHQQAHCMIAVQAVIERFAAELDNEWQQDSPLLYAAALLLAIEQEKGKSLRIVC